jgi:hypothetical protein
LPVPAGSIAANTANAVFRLSIPTDRNRSRVRIDTSRCARESRQRSLAQWVSRGSPTAVSWSRPTASGPPIEKRASSSPPRNAIEPDPFHRAQFRRVFWVTA